MILMKVGFDATILINGYKFSSGSSMASIPYVQDKKKDTLKGVSFFLGSGGPRPPPPSGDFTCSGEMNSPSAKVLPAAKHLYGANAPPHRVGPHYFFTLHHSLFIKRYVFLFDPGVPPRPRVRAANTA